LLLASGVTAKALATSKDDDRLGFQKLYPGMVIKGPFFACKTETDITEVAEITSTTKNSFEVAWKKATGACKHRQGTAEIVRFLGTVFTWEQDRIILAECLTEVKGTTDDIWRDPVIFYISIVVVDQNLLKHCSRR